MGSKIKDSLKFSIAPQAYINKEAKKAGQNDSDFFKSQIERAQKYDPGSKYLGFSGVPGVRSRKSIDDAQETANKQAAQGAADAQNAAIQAEKNFAAQTPAEKRAKRFAYGSYGRSDTLVTGASGLGGTGSGQFKKLLGL